MLRVCVLRVGVLLWVQHAVFQALNCLTMFDGSWDSFCKLYKEPQRRLGKDIVEGLRETVVEALCKKETKIPNPETWGISRLPTETVRT